MKAIVLLLTLLTGVTFSQDYGRQATDKEASVRMHFAIRLLRGNYTKQQEEFLLKGISDRRSISEEEAAQLFTRSELRDVFFGIGREDISTFKKLYNLGRIAEKKEVWQNLSPAERVDARRINFAWGIGYHKLTEPQTEYLVRFSKALPTITREEGDLFQTEAVGLFPKDLGRLMFSSIGSYTDKPCDPVNLQNSCPCSVGSSFNMSCDGDCTAASGRCSTTTEGCGFAWLYSCNGFCQIG
jgi:hypothetical protein